ncbi:hypothetical protein Ahy_A06g026589 isoform A [Arachis hypogaea]|uniref:Pentatricopeptide repeat-containing protein n=1 Tax=Arachis hypogaea TaxID=3818 RepID=A0A445CKZ8_ARAHY|nr:hypothetical protein Ahy_A06g026589 isoform A [Arachis hypogaea]
MKKRLLLYSLSSTLKAKYKAFYFYISSVSLSSEQSKWNPSTNVVITNPTLVAMESCSTMRQLRQIQARMIRTGLMDHTFPASRALAFCALSDSGDVRYAHAVFDRIEQPNTFMWNTMIRGYSRANVPAMAFSFFLRMLRQLSEMDCRTFVFSLKACEQFSGSVEGESKGDLVMGRSIHEDIARKNVRHTLSLNNALLDMYVKCGSLMAARELFDKMEIKDVFSWTSLVNGYAKCGDLESARRFFDQTPHKNVVSWNAMIAGYSQNNKPKESIKLFREMIAAGMVPSEHTLVSVLSACGQLSCLNLGHWIHHHFVNEKRVHLSVTMGNAIIDMYAKCGSIDAAAEVFKVMPVRSLISWNSMIASYAAHGRAKQAIVVFDQMVSMGFRPDDVTFVSLLTACSHGGLVSEGQEYFDTMETKYGVKPKREHYSCMIDLLGRTGLLEGAYKLITSMPMQPCEAAWGALLNACRMHGNVELAKLSAGNLMRLNPEDSGTYILLANICANDRNWGDVRRVRSLMRDKGVKKIAGHSLIEIQGEFKEFLVADESNTQSEEIYKVLDLIYLLAKLEDYDSELFIIGFNG